jgi:hypothetical protein
LGTLPGVGSNYNKQLEKQRQVEEYQKLMQDKFNQNVNSPEQARVLSLKEREARDFNEVKMRFDKEKEFVDLQKQQAKQLNYHQLQV